MSATSLSGHNRHYAKCSGGDDPNLALGAFQAEKPGETIVWPHGGFHMLMNSDKRPCHAVSTKPNLCAAAHYDRMTYNVMPLYGPWAGWRMAGRDLVSPDRQRISPERLRGLLFRQASEKRLDIMRLKRSRRSSQVISLPAREMFAGSA